MKRKIIIFLSVILTLSMLPISAFAAAVDMVVPMEAEDFKVIRGYSGDSAFSVENNSARVNGKSGALSTARYIDVSNATGGIVFTVTYLDDYSGVAASNRGNYHFGVGLMDEQCFMGNANDLGRGFGVDFCFTNSDENAGYRLKSYTYDGYNSLSNSFTGFNRTYNTAGIEKTKSFQLKFEKTGADTWVLYNLDTGDQIATLNSSHFGENLFADNKAYLVFGCYGATPMNMSVTVNQVYGFEWGECFNAVRYGESIELEDSVLTNFYVSYNADALNLDGKVRVALSGRDGLSFNDTEKVYASIKDGELVNGNTYRYTIPLPAAKGNYKINIEIIGNDGRVFRWSTSLEEYLDSLTQQDGSEEMAALSESLKGYCSAAEEYFNLTYESSFEEIYHNYQSLSAAREDQKLIKALVERMGRSAAIYVGSSSVLYGGFKQKLDTEDYSKVTKVIEGDILVAAEFANKYFGQELAVDAEGYVNLTDACRDISGYRLYHDTSSGLAVILPTEIPTFAGSDTIGGYTNAQYRARMIAFFTTDTDEIPEPQNNSEQSRVVISSSLFERNGEYSQRVYTACSSPSITSITENGATVLYASHEFSTVNGANRNELATVTVIKKSTDGGATWTEVGRVKDLRWATAQVVNNTVYLFGNHITTNDAMIAKVDGNTVTSACVASGVGGGGPTAVAIANGRVYKAYNFKAISASVDADLLSTSSWTVSDNTVQDIIGSSCQLSECNLIAKDGTVYALMRIEGDGYGREYAAIAELSADGKTYKKCGSSSIISGFPTGISKFTIKYDEATRKFICFSNISFGNAPNPNERTVLAISTSTDLRNWTTHDYLVVERQMINADAAGFAHGWQYPDFVIDGDKLYYIVRESSGASSGWHSANYVSFYTLENYKGVISG